MALLSMRGIRKSFGGAPANDGVSLDVEAGEIHALLGENGAGKTTLMNILYGIYQADSGEILWKGESLGPHEPRAAIARGIGMVHQHFMLVPTMSVSRNVTLGLKSVGHPFPSRRRLDEAVLGISRSYGLGLEPATLVSELSVGEQQRVEILKLLYREAELLILDEPTSVLTPKEAEGLFAILRRIREEGRSVILITHRIPEVLAIADRITVLRDGKLIATKATAECSAADLSRLMIGRELKRAARAPRSVPAEGRGGEEAPGLELRDVRCSRRGVERLRGASLAVSRGEILGIAGVDGNGQRELAEAAIGLARPGSGSVFIRGRRADGMSVAERKRLGLAYVPDDRHRDALLLGMSLADNYLLEALDLPDLSSWGFVRTSAATAATAAAMADYGIKAPGPAARVGLLSGGNQQKLVLARLLARDPSVIVACQPTRGLDLGAAEFLRERLLERRAAGAAILLVSADLDELLALSDRIMVMHRGRLGESMENGPGLDLTRIGLEMAGQAAGEGA
jgi:general nucleoside transport system ATP-binding protein